jgi:hypothetical protein
MELKIKGLHKFTFRNIAGEIIREKTYENLVVLLGRKQICNALGGLSPNIIINYGAVGTGGNSPSNADTTLQTEFYRVTVTGANVVDNVLEVQQFYGLAEANTQLYEAGEFINGTGVVDSGILFSRWNIDENKTASETLTITSTYTII